MGSDFRLDRINSALAGTRRRLMHRRTPGSEPSSTSRSRVGSARLNRRKVPAERTEGANSTGGGPGHRLEVERGVQLRLGEYAAVDVPHRQHLLTDRPSVRERGLGDLGGLFVAEVL